jgi:branched-chain amino acid transport system permease protein
MPSLKEGITAQLRSSVREPVRSGLTAVAAALVIVGTLTPWATFSFGFPGKMTLSGFPGGARLYPLVLVISAVLIVVRIHGRRRAGVLAAWGIIGITAFNILALAFAESFPLALLDDPDGGGLGAVGFGAWLTLVGGVLLLVAFVSLEDDDVAAEPAFSPTLPSTIELLVIALILGGVLFTVVVGLKVEESSRFISFVALLAFAGLTLSRVGLFLWASELFARHRNITVMAAAVTAVVFPFTQGGSGYWIRVFASIGVFAAAAIGLNIVVGLAGLLDLGYIAFFGVGAYVGALFAGAARSTIGVHLPFLVVVLMGAVIAALFGVVIGAPTLRLRGDYLAIVTLGFGEIFRIVANNFDGLTRGPNGISGVPDLQAGGFQFGESHRLFGVTLAGFANYYFIELVLLAVVITAFVRLNDSRIGRAWVAIREDETAAAAMGVNTVRMKLLAFAMGAFLAGAAGTVNAHVTTQVSPDSYTFLESILLLAAVVLGGMGTIPGALLGSSALFIIPEKLRAFQDKRLLLFGMALVLMMRFRPEGIVASKRRQREFHDDDAGGADAMSAPPGAPVATA